MLRITSNMATPPPTLTSPTGSSVPVRDMPGSYGFPVVGPISDRLKYFWFQGPETFFKKKKEEYKSTVFRTNVPPSFPFFIGVNPKVIAVLDVKSFSHLFDMEIIEKKNVLVGDFMPSVKFTGDMRVGVYLDPSEELHAKVKSFTMDILKRSSNVWVSSLLSSLDTMWGTIDESIAKDGKAGYFIPLQKCIFNFLSKSIVGADPASYSSELADSGYIMLDKWLALMLMPTVKIGVLQPLEEIFLHSFAYPFFLVKGGYDKLAKFIAQEGKEVIQRGKTEFGLSEEEIIHNLLFNLGFNAYGGFTIFMPTLLSALGSENGVQEILRKEVREKCGSNALSFSAIQEMPRVQSFVYETLRLNPPVPLQYGRAKKDFLLESHESKFQVKKGELLCGYQPLVMRDPNVFDDPTSFVMDRFDGEKGRELLNCLYWSNGPQTGKSDTTNKQCPAKDYVPLTACLFLAHLFQRYDSITIEGGSITKVEKANS